MNKEFKYIVVQWPDSQYFIDKEHCHLILDDKGMDMYGSSAYFVRLDVYHEVCDELRNEFSNNKNDN